eukprot:gb/GECH01001407.1/.p1 GENE.gb/GECH01001407.1/~~gb/GECH01001407.1/.p1  ORF type:complete len:165 (+),score=34.92 gb/GECH01001407.1/:1-495(+)
MYTIPYTTNIYQNKGYKQPRWLRDQLAQDARDAFVQFAQNGELQRRDYKLAYITVFGTKPTEEELDHLFEYNNTMCELKFFETIRHRIESISENEYLRDIFDAFDIHCRGFLTLEDVEAAFGKIAQAVPFKTISTVFSEFDENDNGYITFHQFQTLMKYGLNNQ